MYIIYSRYNKKFAEKWNCGMKGTLGPKLQICIWNICIGPNFQLHSKCWKNDLFKMFWFCFSGICILFFPIVKPCVWVCVCLCVCYACSMLMYNFNAKITVCTPLRYHTTKQQYTLRTEMRIEYIHCPSNAMQSKENITVTLYGMRLTCTDLIRLKIHTHENKATDSVAHPKWTVWHWRSSKFIHWIL